MDLDVDQHYGIGPYQNVYGHGPVTMVSDPVEHKALLYLCLDCGYVTDDIRTLLHAECDLDENAINQSWRDYFDEVESRLPTVEEAED